MLILVIKFNIPGIVVDLLLAVCVMAMTAPTAIMPADSGEVGLLS